MGFLSNHVEFIAELDTLKQFYPITIYFFSVILIIYTVVELLLIWLRRSEQGGKLDIRASKGLKARNGDL